MTQIDTGYLFQRALLTRGHGADTAREALDAVAAQMREQGLSPTVAQDEDHLALIVPHAERGAFHYTIRARSFRAPSFAWAQTRRVQDSEHLHYRAVASSPDSDQSQDVTGYSTERLINDLLNRYARFRHARRME